MRNSFGANCCSDGHLESLSWNYRFSSGGKCAEILWISHVIHHGLGGRKGIRSFRTYYHIISIFHCRPNTTLEVISAVVKCIVMLRASSWSPNCHSKVLNLPIGSFLVEFGAKDQLPWSNSSPSVRHRNPIRAPRTSSRSWRNTGSICPPWWMRNRIHGLMPSPKSLAKPWNATWQDWGRNVSDGLMLVNRGKP